MILGVLCAVANSTQSFAVVQIKRKSRMRRFTLYVVGV
jgi:hypothetical protein